MCGAWCMSTCVLCVMYGICLCVFGVCMCVWYMVYVHTYVYAHVCGEGVDVVIVYAYIYKNNKLNEYSNVLLSVVGV